MADDIQRITGTNAKIAARLCNFPTGKSNMLASHRAFLDKEVAPVIRGMQGPWVDMFGYASRLGSASFNQQLSEQRIAEIRKHIATYAKNVNFQIQTGFGESQSGPKETDDSGYYRAVEVYVYASKPPAPKPPKPVVTAATKFEIRVVGGGSASIIAQADNYFFQIVDIVRQQTAFFFYTGGGVGISIPKIPGPGSVTKTGPPTPFDTTLPAELYMFNSKAQLYQDAGATFGNWSFEGTMRLGIDEIYDGKNFIFTKPNLIPISGGAGIQMPGLGSVSKGVLALVAGPWPFSGY
jgi:hypothetical protein